MNYRDQVLARAKASMAAEADERRIKSLAETRARILAAQTARDEQAERQILDYLRQNGPASRRTILAATNILACDYDVVVEKLISAGRVRMVGSRLKLS